MNDITFAGILLFILIISALSHHAAYRNGVRDGFENPWLPHVKKQIEEEGLKQGKLE